MSKGCKGCLKMALRPFTTIIGAVAGAFICAIFLLFATMGIPGGLRELQETILPNLDAVYHSEWYCCSLPFVIAIIVFPIAGSLYRDRSALRWGPFLITLAVVSVGIIGLGIALWLVVPQNVMIGTLAGSTAGAILSMITRRKRLVTRLLFIVLGALTTAGLEFALPYLGSIITAAITGASLGMADPIGVAMMVAETAAE